MIKKLSAYIREYKLSAILTSVFVAMEVVLEVLIPQCMAKIVDVGLPNGDSAYVSKMGILMVFMAMLSLTFGALSGRNAAKSGAGFAKNLRQGLFYKVQELSFANIDKFSTASLVTRLTTDVQNVQMAFSMIIRMLVRSPMMLVSGLVMCFTISTKLTMVFLCVIPFLAFSLVTIMTKAMPNFRNMFKKYDVVNRVVQENLTNVRTVKAFVREDFETEKFTEATDDLYNYSIRAEKLLNLSSPIMQFSMYITILLISWIGAHLVISETMGTGQLMSMFTYVQQILSSLMMISMSIVMMSMAKTSGDRIIEVLDEEVDLTNGENPVAEVPDGSIKFDDVSFSYSKDINKLALENINIDIPSGRTVGIIGGTGSAKTTLVQLIPRLYDVTAGTVYVGGRDVREYDLDALRESVAMVLQKNVLFSGTIKENLRWGNENATDEELIHACKLAQADSFIQTFPDKYDTYIEQGGTNVSGGQKQRLCIARALLKKPKILILDDSTSAVDTATDAMIRKAFREEIPGTTKLIIAQRISSVQDADIIIVMDDGKINGIGTHEQLVESNEIYREVYISQMKGSEE
ncbi:MAG: ABC transporter ATP-binding protein [Oscillospiraceae bacterium]|nr:ABC transporter ATP-binding protein [Oscillospiraceae bacterium]